MNRQIKEIADHIKESMCIDGDVDFLMANDTGTAVKDSTGEYRVLQGVIFECNDSKRGQFFIGWYVGDAQT